MLHYFAMGQQESFYLLYIRAGTINNVSLAYSEDILLKSNVDDRNEKKRMNLTLLAAQPVVSPARHPLRPVLAISFIALFPRLQCHA